MKDEDEILKTVQTLIAERDQVRQERDENAAVVEQSAYAQQKLILERDEARAEYEAVGHALLATDYTVSGETYKPNLVVRAKQLIHERAQLRAKLDEAQAKCAEMRQFLLEECGPAEICLANHPEKALAFVTWEQDRDKILSTACGNGLVSVKELEPISKLAWDLHGIIGNQSTLGEIISRIEALRKRREKSV